MFCKINLIMQILMCCCNDTLLVRFSPVSWKCHLSGFLTLFRPTHCLMEIKSKPLNLLHQLVISKYAFILLLLWLHGTCYSHCTCCLHCKSISLANNKSVSFVHVIMSCLQGIVSVHDKGLHPKAPNLSPAGKEGIPDIYPQEVLVRVYVVRVCIRNSV